MTHKQNPETSNKKIGPLSFIIGVLFVFFIISIVILVTLPELVLTPLSWLLNTEVTYDSFSHSYKPGQSGTYFSYYIHHEGDLYTQLPWLMSITLGTMCLYTLVFTPLIFLGLINSIKKRSIKNFKDVKPLLFIYAIFVTLFALIHNDESGILKDIITFNL